MTRPLRTLALVKQVPRGEADGALDSDGRLRRDGADAEMNPFCRRAVTQAVRLARRTGGHATVATMGPPAAADVLREAAACGADSAIHVSDPALAGSDCLLTARALAAAARRTWPVDVVLVGRNSVDADTGAVGPMLAEVLGLPFVGPALRLDLTADGRLDAILQQDGVTDSVRVMLPAVVAVAERSCPPAKASPETWPADLAIHRLTTDGLGPGPWGLTGSPTRVAAVRRTVPTREGLVFPADQVAAAVDALIERGAFAAAARSTIGVPAPVPRPRRELLVAVGERLDASGQTLLGEAAALALRVDARVIALGSAAHAVDLARYGADEVLAPDAYDPAPLATALDGAAPWAVLAPAGGWGGELLARLAVRQRAGLVSDVIALDVVEGRLRGSKPCGRGHLADIECRSDPQLATIRTGALKARSPRAAPPRAVVRALPVDGDPRIRRHGRTIEDDYDLLDRAETVIGLGLGVAPGGYRALKPLRDLLSAEFAATRPVTDRGWLPHARQLGLTARSIAPRLYIALGISGRPNHLAGIARAAHILAVNADPSAEIFAQCDIGIIGDWRTVVPVLTDVIARRRMEHQ